MITTTLPAGALITSASDDEATRDARGRFLELLTEAAAGAAPVKLVLSKYHGAEAELLRVQVRAVEIKGTACLSFVHRYRTRDVTTNLPLPQALQRVDQLLGSEFLQANLQTPTAEVQLAISKRGKSLLRTVQLPGAGTRTTSNQEKASPAGHNREKQRLLSLERPFLQRLGITDAQQQLIPSMSRKWKQINRFIEVFKGAWEASALPNQAGPLRLIDFGSGKGYLTFALHDYLQNTLGVAVRMTGVELRADLVKTCAETVAALGIEGLTFVQGDIASHRSDARSEADGEAGSLAASFDVMIALHACDTATDDAIHQGIRAGAAIIMCAPCCHKQVRPQLLSPHPLRPILQHGIHLGQEAEMLTDGLRALLMDASGYDTQVFEFISLEHTGKNKMILGVKRAAPRPAGPVLAQIRDIKAFYGIREQRLESLLAPELSDSHH